MKKFKRNKASKRQKGVDMISNLPDHVLQLILSGLPTTEEAVRTSVLSKRWRYLWASIPSRDADCTRKLTNFNESEFKEFVDRLLLDRSVDLDSFRLRCENHYDMSTVWRWIRDAIIRKVKLLDLSFSPRVDDDQVIRLPPILVTCDSLEVLRLSLSFTSTLRLPTVTGFPALRVLQLNSVHLRLPTITGFPALRVLQLNRVHLMDVDSVQPFLRSCPLLEDLSLIDCFSYSYEDPLSYSDEDEDVDVDEDVCISCLNLKTLRVHNRNIGTYTERFGYGGSSEKYVLCVYLHVFCPKLVFLEYAGHSADELLIENLDSLKKAVIYPDGRAHKEITFESYGANTCQLFAGVSHVESLSLNLFFIQAISTARDPNGVFAKSLPNLKTLEISTTIDDYTMNVVIRILRCSPILESFHLIIQEEIFWPEVWKLDEVLTHHLKRVEFLEFNGEQQKLDMARFLLENGNELEEMVFSWRGEVNYHEKSMEIMKEMLKFDMASSTVKLITLLKD
ncbi:putative F-box domain, FBD domain, leucine-rich repeat domain superfamily [Helianthus annuus]|nr:putative F-box domain, FBD domain, leucine-rich repeat domain superfamily [Helianthus annuus]